VEILSHVLQAVKTNLIYWLHLQLCNNKNYFSRNGDRCYLFSGGLFTPRAIAWTTMAIPSTYFVIKILCIAFLNFFSIICFKICEFCRGSFMPFYIGNVIKTKLVFSLQHKHSHSNLYMFLVIGFFLFFLDLFFIYL
jgi:hypothetical protein